MSLLTALTVGDPSGIGPEIALKAWMRLRDTPFVLIADQRHILPYAVKMGVPVKQVDSVREAADIFATALPILQHDFPADALAGGPNPDNAQAIIDVITRAVDLTQNGCCGAVCTNPINKKVLMDGADFPYPGHTEFLAHLGGKDHSVMMLTAPELRVVPVTVHIPLADVPKALTRELLVDTLEITHAALQSDFGIDHPRIAVSGLNPHAGEGGKIGVEDRDLIEPVLAEMRLKGLTIMGPMSADTMFHTRARALYDVAVCMYHDQALIPIKTLNFDKGVNTTLGLPFIRTSPDHGTAYDIAGTGKADESSLVEALRAASTLAHNKAANG